MSSIKSLTKESIVSHSAGVLSADIDNETILLSIENSKYYGMASTGNRIWGLLTSPISIAEIIDTLVQEYQIGREQCEADVFEFLSQLLSNKLITQIE